MEFRVCVIFIYIYLTIQVLPVFSWKSLLKRIPNGHHVTNPCDPSKLWEGVGHLEAKGYGKRNQFGKDFKQHNLVWTPGFCMTDSDGDGRTNGEELGDPQCNWTTGSNVTLDSSNVTHPGVCEPLDTPFCKGRNSWLTCESTEFKCDAINEPDVQNVTIKFPRQKVPPQATTHRCMIIDFPQDGDFHMVATKPFMDNRKVMHHILLYGCDDSKVPAHAVNEPYDCGIVFDPACRDLMSLWLLGVDGQCSHEDAGFRLGTYGYKRGGIQVHWENRELLETEMDGSGMTLFYTSKTRMHDAGILFVGQDYMAIPPGETTHVESGTCASECTRRKLAENIHFTAAVNHMHYLGSSMKMEQLRGGRTIEVITDEADYQYDSPIMHTFKTPIEFHPGDEIRYTCVYNSTSRDLTTLAGSGYMEEMCFGFLTYYPKQALALGNPTCTSWRTIPTCLFELDKQVYGCDYKNAHNLSHPETKQIYDKIMTNCRPLGPCFKECQQAIAEIRKLPCYHGDMWTWSRNKMASNSTSEEVRAKWFPFFAAFDSCGNTDVHKECEQNGNKMTSHSSSTNVHNTIKRVQTVDNMAYTTHVPLYSLVLCLLIIFTCNSLR